MSEPKTTISEEIDPDLLDERNSSSSEILDQTAFADNEIPTKIINPFDIDLQRFVPNTQVMTLERFIEIADQVIQAALTQVEEPGRVLLVEEYPAEEMQRLGDDVIVWRVLKRKPANLSTTGNGRPARGFMHEYTVRSSSQPNKIISVEKRLLDHDIEFAVYSKSAKLANRRALWLERLFINNRWAFESQGADRFHWVERRNDTYTNTNGQKLYVRPLVFFFRGPEFRVKAAPVLHHIEYQIKPSSEDDLVASSRIE